MLNILKVFHRTKESGKPRDLRFEILRIIAMFMVVFCHAICNSALSHPKGALISATFSSLSDIGKVGVAIFFILTGYFCCQRQFSAKHIIKTFTHVWWYAIIMLSIFLVASRLNLLPDIAQTAFDKLNTWGIVLSSILPILSYGHWFIISYLILLLVSPMLNKFIQHSNRKQLGYLILALSAVHFIKYTFVPNPEPYLFFMVSIITYLIGAWIKLYGHTIKLKTYQIWLLICGSCAFNVFIHYIANLPISHNGALAYLGLPEMTMNSGVAIAENFVGAGIFILFTKIKPILSNSILCRATRLISASVLGIYLISDSAIIREALWKKVDLLTTLSVNDAPYIRLLALTIASIVVFVICNILSIIYDHLVVNRMVKLTLNASSVKRLCTKLDNIVND